MILKTESHTAHESATASSLFVPARRRFGIEARMLNNEATPAEILHVLLGANASHTLTGALVQAHVFAEMVADGCADRRHLGTLAQHLVAQLATCIALADELDLEGNER
jgi:hypothetical protein